MVLYVSKYDIIPDKVEAYSEWAKSAVARILASQGVVEFRGYRPASGSHQVVITVEFADMAAWAAWFSDADMQQLLQEGRNYETNVSIEIWGPSPIVPEPIRPGG